MAKCKRAARSAGDLDEDDDDGPRCKCGSRDHQRTSHKDCLLHVPRVVERNNPNPGVEEKTVTNNIGLKAVPGDQGFLPFIVDAVKRVTLIGAEACRLLNGFVIWRLEQNLAIPDLSDQTTMRQFFQAVTVKANGARTVTNNPDLEHFVANNYLIDQTICRGQISEKYRGW